MLVIKKVTRQSDGTYSAEWKMTQEQLAYLLTYAINNLVAQGVVDVDIEAHYQPEQLELEFLSATEVQGNA